jgi:hypothetical protein
MRHCIRWLAVPAILLLAACSSEPPTAEMLGDRATTTLTPAEACNRPANIEYLPDGARIRIPDTALFVIGRTDLSPCGQFALASVVEAMLEPGIMQVVIEPGGDIESPDAYLPRQRAATMQSLLSHVGFSTTQPPVLVRPAPIPSAGTWGVVLLVVRKT